MLTVGLAEIFVEFDTMTDRKDRVGTIYSKENDIGKISGGQNQISESEQYDKSHRNRSHVTSETLGLLTEIKETEYQ